MDYDQQRLIVGLLKAGQDSSLEDIEQTDELEPVISTDKKKKVKPRKPILPGSYPDYRKSIASRARRRSPVAAGLHRAGGAGLTGAILGTLLARIISNKPKNILTGTALGGLAGAIPGFISGHDEALSDHSKMLYLRQKGINTLGELMARKQLSGVALEGEE